MAELTRRKQLDELFGAPPAIVLAKTIHHLDAGALSWLAASTIMIASVANGDDLDVVLGGGVPGWASGDKTLLHLPVDALDAPQRFAPGSGFGSIFMVPSLNGLRVVRVTNIAAHRDSHELSAEMIFEARSGDLLAIKKVLWAHEPNDRVYEKRLECSADRIGARLAGLLIHTEMSIGRHRADPCPVSKYITLLPTVPRPKLRPASMPPSVLKD